MLENIVTMEWLTGEKHQEKNKVTCRIGSGIRYLHVALTILMAESSEIRLPIDT